MSMRYFCKAAGTEIRRHWKDCGECKFLTRSLCPMFKVEDVPVWKPFWEWFEIHRKKPPPEPQLSECETQSSEQRVNEE